MKLATAELRCARHGRRNSPVPSLEERFTQLEKRFADLRAEVLGLQPRAKDGRRTVGMMPDDEIARNAARLGRDWRDGANAE